MRVVITGGAGFIGANLCAALAADPRTAGEIVAYDDFSTGSHANLLGLDVDVVAGSVLDADALREAFTGADAVVHLAAKVSVAASLRDPAGTYAVNATGTAVVLDAARRSAVRHVVLASSAAVYGEVAGAASETRTPRPANPYGASKLAAERCALSCATASGLDVLALRLFNVYGPLQRAAGRCSAVVPAFVTAALDGRAVTLHGDGAQSREFTYVGTVCSVLRQALIRRAGHPGPVNLGFGRATTVLDLLGRIEALLGRPLRRRTLPARAAEVRHSVADGRLLADLFPAVRPVPLSDGLAETLRWHEAALPRAGLTGSLRRAGQPNAALG